MKKYLIVLVILNVVLLTRCEQEKDYNLDLIKRSWTHSFEEDSADDYLTYRPSNYKEFPPSRFRQCLDFKDNYVCSFLVVSPNDAHYTKEGVWEYDEPASTIKIMDENSVLVKFKILELNKNVLRLKVQ